MQDFDPDGQRPDQGQDEDKHGQDKTRKRESLLGSANKFGEPRRPKEERQKRKQGQNACKTEEQQQKELDWRRSQAEAVAKHQEEMNQRLTGGVFRPPQTFDLMDRPFFSPPPMMPPSSNFFHASEFFPGKKLFPSRSIIIINL